MITEAAIQLISKSSNILEFKGNNHQQHCDIYETIYNLGIKTKNYKVIEGFIDENNIFYDRYEAFNYAKNCHQLSEDYDKEQFYVFNEGQQLYTEDLW